MAPPVFVIDTGWGWIVNPPQSPYVRWKYPPVPFEKNTNLAPDLFWKLWRRDNLFIPAGSWTTILWSAASSLATTHAELWKWLFYSLFLRPASFLLLYASVKGSSGKLSSGFKLRVIGRAKFVPLGEVLKCKFIGKRCSDPSRYLLLLSFGFIIVEK